MNKPDPGDRREIATRAAGFLFWTSGTGVVAIFFLCTLAASALFRMVLVSQLFREFDLGLGFSVPDSLGFHFLGLEKAKQIEVVGWQAWQLRPQGLFPAGMASLLYLLTPSPWLLLGFNSLLHALSGGLLFSMLRRFFSPLASLCGAVMFVVNPLSLEWTANLHRDGVFILGNFLFLFGTLDFLPSEGDRSKSQIGRGLLAGIVGSLLVWCARPYWIPPLWLFTFFLLILLLTLAVGSWARRRRAGDLVPSLGGLLAAGCLFAFELWMAAFHVTSYANVELPPPAAVVAVASSPTAGQILQAAPVEPKKPVVDMERWDRTPGLPEFADLKLFTIARCRRGSIGSGGNSLVDTDVLLYSAREFLDYFPRALVVGLGSPLPSLWRGEGSKPGYTKARLAMGGITPVIWVLLAGAVLGMRRHRRNLAAWWMILFALGGLLIFTYAYANVGALMRFRYGFHMLLVAFGAASWLEFFQTRRAVPKGPGA